MSCAMLVYLTANISNIHNLINKLIVILEMLFGLVQYLETLCHVERN